MKKINDSCLRTIYFYIIYKEIFILLFVQPWESRPKFVRVAYKSLSFKNLFTFFKEIPVEQAKDSTVTVTNTGGGTAIYNAS